MAAFRAAGFGLHTDGKGVMEWRRDFCQWLDQRTHYRSYAELRQAFDRYFTNLDHHEVYWLDTRYGPRCRFLAHVPDSVKRLVVRKWAGLVITCRKASSAC